MKPVLKFAACILFTGAIFYISCQKKFNCEDCREGNKPPIAHAGKDTVIVLPVDSIMLDGRASTDPENNITGYAWRKISGSVAFNIQNASAASTLVKNIISGAYEFELMVTDNAGLSAKDTIKITVDSVVITNHPPIAKAGNDTTIILPANNVTLDGSASSDPENNIAGYLWTKISGPTSFNITTSNSVQTQLTNLTQGSYQFELKVTDAGGLFAKDTVNVVVNATTKSCSANRPIINAQITPFGNLSLQKVGVSVGSAGNKIVFAGGRDWAKDVSSASVDIYDIATNTWSTAQLSAPREGMAVATSGSKIFFGGGWYTDSWIGYHSNKVDIYDASTDTWSVATLSVSRTALAATSVGNKAFFAGGYDNICVCPLKTVDIYDLTTRVWSTATLSEARSDLSALSVGSKAYFAGGRLDYYSSSSRIDIYDNSTSTWSTSTMVEAKGAMASIAFAGKIYWAGGRFSSGNDPNSNGTNSVEIRDVNAQTSSFSCLFRPDNWYSIPNATVEKNSTLIFFNGWVEGQGTQTKFDIYEVAANKWAIGVLNKHIYEAAIISVNHTIYVAGGLVNGFASNQVWKLEF